MMPDFDWKRQRKNIRTLQFQKSVAVFQVQHLSMTTEFCEALKRTSDMLLK